MEDQPSHRRPTVNAERGIMSIPDRPGGFSALASFRPCVACAGGRIPSWTFGEHRQRLQASNHGGQRHPVLERAGFPERA